MDYNKIIDISQYNGKIDWSKLNKYYGVIIRAGYRGYTVGAIKEDLNFKENIAGAIENNIPVGVYFVTQAITENEAIAEAMYVIDQIKNYNIKLPIFIDSELSGASENTGRADGLSKSVRTKNVKAFCEKIEAAGYLSGVYANKYWFTNNLAVSELVDYYIWVAEYADVSTVTHKKDMWQYTNEANIEGVSGNVDLSEYYIDFYNINKLTDEQIAHNIQTVQKWLNEYYGDYIMYCKACGNKLLDVDGLYGKKTKAGLVIALQIFLNDNNANLVVDGIYGPITNSKVIIIQLNDRTVGAKIVQAILQCNGYNPQMFYNLFNEDCVAALKEYQADKNLEPDGKAGPLFFSKTLG